MDEPLGISGYAAVGAAAAFAVLLLSMIGVASAWPYFTITGVLFLILGGLCLRSYARCRAVHCAMSGPPYVVLGSAALLAAAGVLALSMRAVWIAFVVIVVASFGTEALYVRLTRSRSA